MYSRVTNTSEVRGVFSDKHIVPNLISDSYQFKYVNLKFGFETEPFMNHLGLAPSDSIHISKFPAIEHSNPRNRKINSRYVVSFLGYPTKNKGHQHILEIIKSVTKTNPNITWQVHLYENDSIFQELKELELDISIIIGKVDENVLQSAITNSDLLCLPYSVTSFKLNASAMFYNSCDMLVPVITFFGSGFSADVQKFNCGSVVNSLEEMILNISQINDESLLKWRLGCSEFNRYRNEKNLEFLDIPH